MSGNPLGPDEPREGEKSRIEFKEPFVGMGQGIERRIQVFGEFGKLLETIVVKAESVNVPLGILEKKLKEMETIFGSNVTQIDAYIQAQERFANAVASSAGIEILSQGMDNATDSADNFNRVLELMQQNLGANVVVAESVVKREKASAAAKKKRDKERDKTILGISGAAIALKAFNKVIAPFKQGISSIEAGFNKNMAVIFDSLENFGEALGRPFLDTFETWGGAIDDVTEGVLTRQDAWDTFGASINEIGNLFAEFPDLKEDFLSQFVDLRDLLRTFQVTGISAADEQQFLTSAGLAADLLRDIETRIANDEAQLEELRIQTAILQEFIDTVAILPGFMGGGLGGGTQTSSDGLFGGLFGV